MSLTETQVRKSYPKEKIYFLADDDGLSLKVDPNGKKSWSYRYSVAETGKRPRVTLGTYPEMNLKEARVARDSYKATKFSTQNLVQEKIQTFKVVCEEWLEFKTNNSFKDQPRGGVIQLANACLINDIYPVIGDIDFSKIKRTDLVKVIKQIENRGVKEPVKKAYSYLNQIYDFAVAMGYCDYNQAYGLNKILLKGKLKKNYPYLKDEEISNFILRITQLNTDPIIKKAILFKLYTGVRGAELLSAEPHHFDFDNKIWKIPALHIKQYRRKVIAGYDIPDFLVPLSSQVVSIVRSALEWSQGDRYVFASPKIKDKPLHFNTINSAIRKMGYKTNELSSHGLRSTFSTILNDSGLFQDSWIEAQLSHVDKNKTRASYNHADYIQQRADMMQWWGDYLENKSKSSL